VAADGQDRLPPGCRQVELDEAAEAAGERRVAAVALAEAEAPRRLRHVELEPAGGAIKPSGHMTQEAEGRGPQRREPESLRIRGSRVVAEGVDDGIGPGTDSDRLAHEASGVGRPLPSARTGGSVGSAGPMGTTMY